MVQIVTDPKTGEVHEFPDDVTPEQMRDALDRPKGGLLDHIIQAATFGLSDEAKALGSATGDWLARQFGAAQGKDFGADYSGALAQERERLATASPAAKVAGAVIGGLGMAPAAAGAVNLARQGAAQGAAYGAGSGEGLEGRALGAGMGAAVGGTLGAVVPRVVSGIQSLASTPVQRAASRIARAADRGGVPIQDIPARMAAGGPGTTVAEAGGESMRRLARAVANAPGESGATASRVLTERSRQMPEEIARSARGALGDVNAYGAFDAIAARQRTVAGPLYQEAYSRPMPFTEHLEELLKRPAMRSALKSARVIAQNEGDDLPQWFVKLADKDGPLSADDFVEIPSTKIWHYVRQGLDDQLEKYRNALGKLELDNAGRAVQSIRHALDAEMKSLNPALAAADQTFSGMSRAKDAMARGQQFMGRRPEEIARQMAGLSDSEREFFRLGVAQKIDDRMSDITRGNSAVSRMADVPSFEAKVRAIFPSDDSATVFLDLIKSKGEQQAFKNAVLAGSRTAPLASDIADVGGGQAQTAIDAIRAGSVRGFMARKAADAINRYRAGIGEQTRNLVGETLFAQSWTPEMARAMASSAMPAASMRTGAVRATVPLGVGAVAPLSRPAPEDPRNNLIRSGQALMQSGVPPHVAAGFVKNFEHESGGDPRAIGDSGTSIGLAQWHGPRSVALERYAQRTEQPIEGVDTQMGYLLTELESDPQLKAKLWSATSAEEAAAIVQRDFERPKTINPKRSEGASQVMRELLGMAPGAYTAGKLAAAPPPVSPRPSRPGAITEAVNAKYYGPGRG